MDHLGDEAELYALGLLEADERERVDAHVGTCGACAERLGEAERTVAALVERSQRRRAPASGRWALAVAAALVLMSGGLVQQNLALRGALGEDGQILDGMVESHFAHAPFLTPAGGPFPAKVVYDEHGRWLQVIAVRPADWRISVTSRDGTARELAEHPVVRGPASMLFVQTPAALRTVTIEDSTGKTLGRATLVFPADRR